MPNYRDHPAERRQISEEMTFPERLTPHINFQRLGERAVALRANLDVRQTADGGMTVTIFWPEASADA